MRWRELAMTTARRQCSEQACQMQRGPRLVYAMRCDADGNVDMVEADVAAAVPDVLYA